LRPSFLTYKPNAKENNVELHLFMYIRKLRPYVNRNFISPTDILSQLRENRRGSTASGDFRHYYRGRHHNRHSRRRQTVHSHHGLLLPPGIPPAYPATGYRAVYSSALNMADRRPVRQHDDAATWVNNILSTLSKSWTPLLHKLNTL
jgi:hypothetical protein